MRIALFLLLLVQVPSLSRGEDPVDFAEQIQPIFIQHCAKCHGERAAKGDLRLHTAAAIRAADVDYLLSPEKPADAELLARITYPIWYYVSVTGVLIYLMLYHFNPPPPG